MTIRQVQFYPSKVLEKKSVPIEDFESKEFTTLIEDMKATCKGYRAEGLSAVQIGVHQRVFVVRMEDGEFKVFANPEITDTDGKISNKEGCLSFPGVVEFVERAEDITVKAQDEFGEEFTVSADGMEAIAIQHENDHLDGILFIHKVSPLKRRMMLKKLAKMKKKYNIGR